MTFLLLRLRGPFEACLFLGLLVSWLGLAGGWHWFLDLFSHFRWQYALASAAAVLWTWLLRKPLLWKGFAVLTLALNVFEIVGGQDGFPPVSEKPRQTLKMVTFNVQWDNPHRQRVLGYLQNTQADVLLLIEVDDGWMQALEGLKAEYPYGVYATRDDKFGLALLSKRPLEKAAVLEGAVTGIPYVRAEVDHDNRRFLLLGIHPPPPLGRGLAEVRDLHFQEISGVADAAGLPVLVSGDFNASPWSHGMRLLKSGQVLGRAQGVQSWPMTWKARTPLALPIDHSLATPPLRIWQREMGDASGSDHCPQELVLGWDGQ